MIKTLLVVLLLTAADRALKVAMTALLADGPLTLIGGFLGLRYVENTGAAFGIFAQKTALLAIFTVAVMCVLLYILLFRKPEHWLVRAGLILIVAGGFGNLYDRVYIGYVVDYIELLFVNFAVFNFADMMINVGAAAVIVGILFFDKKKPAGEQSA